MSKETAYYHVTSTFTDKLTGKTILPGGLHEATEQRAQRLRAADVIGEKATADEVAEFTEKKPNPEPTKDKGEAKPNVKTKTAPEPAADTGGDKDAGDTKDS